MKELFSLYLQAGFYGSIIVLLVLCLRLFLQKAPRRFVCLLWLLVAVRLLVPFQMESPFSLQPHYENLHTPESMIQQPELSPDTPAQTPVTPSTPAGDTPTVTPSLPLPTTPPVNDPVSSSPQPQPQPQPVDTMQILSMVWICVSYTLLLYMVGSYILLRVSVRGAVLCGDGILESERIRGPFLLGYISPKIYLPTNLASADIPFIISHEQAHIARGDNWWKLLGFICVCIHWYNPLVWLSYIFFSRDIEAACDERVIGNMDLNSRKAYSTALLNCGKHTSGLSACPVAFGEINLKQRIKNVLSYRKPGFWISLVTILLVAIVAICFLTTPKSSDDEAGDPTQVQTTDPTDPSNPTDPTDPTNPTEPTEPSEPTDPTEPTERSEPTDPTDPTEPSEPTEPTEPTEPNKPTEPTEPTTPTAPDSHNWVFLEQREATANTAGGTFYQCSHCNRVKLENVKLASEPYASGHDCDTIDQIATRYAAGLGFQTLETHPNTNVKSFSCNSSFSSRDQQGTTYFLEESQGLVDDAYEYCISKGYDITHSVIWVECRESTYSGGFSISVYCASAY